MVKNKSQFKHTEVGSIPEDWEVLRKFRDKARELKDHADFFKNISINFKFGDISTEINKNIPDYKIIKACLMDFRPFILNEEAINFYRICKLICNSSKGVDQSLIDKTKEAKKAWSSLHDKSHSKPLVGGIGFNAFGKNFKQGEILDMWLNGKYFHPTDQEKKKYKELERVSVHPFSDLLEIDFIDTVQKMSWIIFWLDFNVIKEILNEK
jgi:hypothetical protein